MHQAASGANDFIEKPFETKKLLHIIQKNLLELKQKVTINNYRNQISFHTKINNIGFSDYIENFLILLFYGIFLQTRKRSRKK